MRSSARSAICTRCSNPPAPAASCVSPAARLTASSCSRVQPMSLHRRRPRTAPLRGAPRSREARRTRALASADRAQTQRPRTDAARAMNPEQVRQIFEHLRAANPHPQVRAAVPFAVRTAGRGDPVGAGDRQERQSGDASRCSEGAPTPQAMLKLGLRASSATSVPSDCTTPRRSNILATCRMLVERTAARCRASARRSSHCPAWDARPRTWCSTWLSASPRWRSTRTCFGSPIAPGWRAAPTPRAVEDELLRVIPAEFMQPRASLADPARPLHLQGASAGVPALPDRALVRVCGKDDPLDGKAPATCSKIARASVCLL